MYCFEIPKELRGRVSAILIEDADQLLSKEFDGSLVAIGIVWIEGVNKLHDLLILAGLEPDASRKEEGQ